MCLPPYPLPSLPQTPSAQAYRGVTPIILPLSSSCNPLPSSPFTSSPYTSLPVHPGRQRRLPPHPPQLTNSSFLASRLLTQELVQVSCVAGRSPHDPDFISITLLSWVSGFCRPGQGEEPTMCEGSGGKHGRREMWEEREWKEVERGNKWCKVEREEE